MLYSSLQFLWLFKKFFLFTSRETIRTWAAFSNSAMQSIVLLKLFGVI